MPQMSPLSWLALFLVFSVTFVIFSIMNYYSMNYSASTNSKMKTQLKKINWSW
ncbi:ATP synthase F0 subunit 8 (mitochondrion) [Agrilus planipennis]|uniref:ATP synthase complex subunit 8 n=1 Tax=Agrilus planipennis TaxID=224129 RepID=A0A1B0VF88_AGRPL|nr:ATP synthase F0 subunit 8 [Agrilus planipennis]AMV73988.1 ATP synthase F0 subunit 8 [Agrilus planipennis]